MHKKINIRAIAAIIVSKVINNGIFLNNLLKIWKKKLPEKDYALLQEICFGIMRIMPKLKFILCFLMKKKKNNNLSYVYYLLIVGIYQLLHTNIPAYACIYETVEGVILIKNKKLKGLVNGILRNCNRQKKQLEIYFKLKKNNHLHPKWLEKKIKKTWKESYKEIIEANNQHPPMWLRVNRLNCKIDKYIDILNKNCIKHKIHFNIKNAIKLDKACNINLLPFFYDGWVSVQDVSAQYAALLLEPTNKDSILDLCAAPGGKTTHILEIAPYANVIAVDINKDRASLINDNLHRLGLNAEVIIGDSRKYENLSRGKLFDRILIDAPCSATGIIRRHPEIKWLRNNIEIFNLIKIQKEILNSAWLLLKKGGILLYATCSILPEENNIQIENFLKNKPNSKLLYIKNIPNTTILSTGIQFLQKKEEGDGFFYAKIGKK